MYRVTSDRQRVIEQSFRGCTHFLQHFTPSNLVSRFQPRQHSVPLLVCNTTKFYITITYCVEHVTRGCSHVQVYHMVLSFLFSFFMINIIDAFFCRNPLLLLPLFLQITNSCILPMEIPFTMSHPTMGHGFYSYGCV